MWGEFSDWSSQYCCGNRKVFSGKATQLPSLLQGCLSRACTYLQFLHSPVGFSPIGGSTAELAVMKAPVDPRLLTLCFSPSSLPSYQRLELPVRDLETPPKPTCRLLPLAHPLLR